MNQRFVQSERAKQYIPDFQPGRALKHRYSRTVGAVVCLRCNIDPLARAALESICHHHALSQASRQPAAYRVGRTQKTPQYSDPRGRSTYCTQARRGLAYARLARAQQHRHRQRCEPEARIYSSTAQAQLQG
jgi:hypothetical protein